VIKDTDSQNLFENKIDSYSKKRLVALFESRGEKRFRADQIFKWVFGKRVTSFEEMTDLSVALREKLINEYSFTILKPIDKQISKLDGSTKVLFQLEDGNMIESVILVDGERYTACVSTQVGCRMGCAFCSTAKAGFIRNLSQAEIIRQIFELEKILGRSLTNLVFMGMGEPLDNPDNLISSIEIILDNNCLNFSHKKVTVSTCGLTDRLMRIFELSKPVNIAVSINATTQAQREKIMPVSRKYPLDELILAMKNLPLDKRKRVTVEYVLLKGVNDSLDDAKRLVKMIRGLKVLVNLIRYNTSVMSEFQPSTEKDALQFQEYLIKNRINTFLRKSLGSDIDGACGQLYGKKSK